MKKRLLNIALALGLVTGLFIGAIAPAGATPEFPGEPTIYFPWVPNNDTIAGIEGVTGSITVQNVEIFPVDVVVTDADGNELTSITLNPRASQTWTADQLGLPEPGSGVIAVAAWNDINDLLDNDAVYICDAFDYDTTHTTAGGIDQVDFFAPVDGIRVSQDGFVFPPDSYNWQHDGTTLFVDWSPDGPEPAEGSTYTVTVLFNCPLPSIAGLEKHTVGTAGARTTSATEMVDGYSAVPLIDLVLAGDGGAVLEGQSRWVVPIVQTNSGWNTEIVITNVSGMNNSVNATYYAAGGQGYAGPSEMILSGRTLAPGETVRVDLRDYGFPEGEVGSLWVDGTHAVVAAAFRMKPSTEMMLTTVAQPRTDIEALSPTLKYGPLVFRDYNGWNTGINIANLSSATNQVSVTYYNYAGNVVAAETRNIPARAMEYVYTPATGNFGVGENQITAVRIQGTGPLAAAIDEVKYLGGQGEGHAMSYAAGRAQVGGDAAPLANGRVLYESMLALPLVQKGNPATGYGDTSGINLFNPSGDAVVAAVQFLDSAGVPVAPTVDATDAEAPTTMPVPAGAGVTVYTLSQSEMTAGFQGSAVVGVVGDGALVGVSNNVNYEVIGDGSAVFNLVPTPFFNIGFGFTVDSEPENPMGTTHEITVTVSDAFGPIEGIAVECEVVEGPNEGTTDGELGPTPTNADGEATCWYVDFAATNDDNVDTIRVWVDLNGDDEEDFGEVVQLTKTWVASADLTAQATVLSDGDVVEIDVELSDEGGAIPGATIICAFIDGPNYGVVDSDEQVTDDDDGKATCQLQNGAGSDDPDTVLVEARDSDGNVLARTKLVVDWTV